MDLQKLIDTMGDLDRRTRSLYHLTLGQLIAELKQHPSEMLVYFDWNHLFPQTPDSYRGYYDDLAWDWGPRETTVMTLLSQAEGALGAHFTGYKGGDFEMDEATPLWAAEYGTTSRARAIMGIRLAGDHIVLETKPMDD